MSFNRSSSCSVVCSPAVVKHLYGLCPCPVTVLPFVCMISSWFLISFRRWGLNLHFKPLCLPPLPQSTSHKNVMAAIERTGHAEIQQKSHALCQTQQGRYIQPVVTAWRSVRSLCVWLSTCSPFPTSWHQPESDFNQEHILRLLCWCNVAPRRANDRPFIKQEEELTTVSISYFWRRMSADNKELSGSNRSRVNWNQ